MRVNRSQGRLIDEWMVDETGNRGPSSLRKSRVILYACCADPLFILNSLLLRTVLVPLTGRVEWRVLISPRGGGVVSLR